MNDFIKYRMELWLEPRLKKATEEEAIQIKNEAAIKFSMQNWLVDAAKRAGQLSITTHPSKFTHPSAKSTSVIAINKQSNDGYLRSGNVNSPLDVFGNAAAMDVYRFLSLPVRDDKHYTLLDAFEQTDEDLRSAIISLGLDFDALQKDFLKIKTESDVVKTDPLLKQVYFPTLSSDNKYHLLSLLTASGLISEIKQRIDNFRFSKDAKSSRLAKKSGNADENGHKDLLNLTVIAYGGSHPKNISVLAQENFGKFYLVPCIPPLFEKRTVRLPTRDFFTQSLYLKSEKERFIVLHKWVKQDRNNVDVREKIQKIIGQVIDQILYKSYQLRNSYDRGWSKSEHYQNLPLSQKIWLDDVYLEDRKNTTEWSDEITKQMAKIIIDHYDAINDVKILGDPEWKYIAELIKSSIEEDKEFF